MKNRHGDTFLDREGHYKNRDENSIFKEVDQIISIWQAFLISHGEEHMEINKDYYIHRRNLFEVIKRLDKRRVYYYVFHGIDDICEYKEIGIFCYWINTLKPFMVVNPESKIYNAPNEMFSLYLITCVLSVIYKKKYPENEFIPPDKKTIQDYIYNFKYCDLSREATIFFVETFAKSYGIGMETNASRDKRCNN